MKVVGEKLGMQIAQDEERELEFRCTDGVVVMMMVGPRYHVACLLTMKRNSDTSCHETG